ncbi:tyrosine-protein phosphatase non-receptor type substrate 1-like isoform X2 [Mobula hypostoma]|uniref:tyrosine-protein phosphatase non-receptor type substrate 1-like isoform X2 n=1 Tax=Mobula hypostoma TaxID=723540 RepID=UPI002FC3B839
MQIFDLLQYLLVLQITYTVADRASFTVDQIPEQVTKTEGENVSIYCTYPIFAQNSLVDVYWRKGEQKQFIDATAERRMSIITSEQGSAELHILGVSFRDSGIYYCSVSDWTRKFSHGNGTSVIVHVPPAPLKITEENAPSVALTCTTAAFFPKNYELIWHKNEMEITSGIHTTQIQNEEGLYLVSSSLNVIESWSVYTCQVFHESMTAPISEYYRIRLGTRDKFIFILTGALAACGVIILALLLLIRRFRVDRTEAAENDETLSRYQENQASERQDAGSPSYADLNFKRDNKSKKVRSEAELTNALIIQGTEDKLIYTCVDLAASQKNARRVQKTHETEYAGIKIKEEARNLETKRTAYSH